MTDVFIRAVAAEVKGHGKKYENSLKERERNNPKYSFLLKKNVCDIIYFVDSRLTVIF